MTLTDFRARLRSEHHLFTDTLAFIAEHYSYTPSAFDNGSVSNPAGQNEGSCKTLGFAILEGLSLEEPYRPLHSDPRQPSPPAGLADTRRKKAGPPRGPRPSRRRKRGAASVTAWRWIPRWT